MSWLAGMLGSYDALNRLTSVVYSQAGQSSLTDGWSFDQTGAGYANGVGRLTSTSFPTGSSRYTYDPQGRLLTDIQRVTAITGGNAAQISNTVTYTYDSAGHVSSIVYPSGRKLSITYADGVPRAFSLAKDSVATPVALISAMSPRPGAWSFEVANCDLKA